MALILDAATDLGTVLAKILDEPLVKQANRMSKLFGWLNKRSYLGKLVDWRIDGSGRTASKVASGADAPAATEDTKFQPSLTWGRYVTTVQIADDALTAALNAGESAMQNVLQDEFGSSVETIMSSVNADLYSGSGANSVVGLDTALSTSDYAGVTVASLALWQTPCFGDTGTILALDTIDQAQEDVVNNGSGRELGDQDAFFSPPDLWKKWAQLNDASGGGRTVTVAGTAGSDANILSLGGRSALHYDGAQVFRDKDVTTNTIFGLRKDKIELRYMPFTNSDGMIENKDGDGVMFHIIKLGRTGSAVKFEVSVQVQLSVKQRNAHECIQASPT